MGLEKVIYTTEEFFHWKGAYGFIFQLHKGNGGEIRKFEDALHKQEPAINYSKRFVDTDWNEVMNKKPQLKQQVVTIADTFRNKRRLIVREPITQDDILLSRLKKKAFNKIKRGK